MRQVIGILIMIAAVIGGIYLGVVWAFIGGIVDIVNAAKAPTVEALPIATGIAKFVFSAVIGWATVIIGVFAGALVGSK